jgi:hypothetical protein
MKKILQKEDIELVSSMWLLGQCSLGFRDMFQAGHGEEFCNPIYLGSRDQDDHSSSPA